MIIKQDDAHQDAIKLLIGNKSDLINDRKVDNDEAQKYADINSMDFFETSAKEAINVDECFMHIGRRIINECELCSNDNDPGQQNPHCCCVVL